MLKEMRKTFYKLSSFGLETIFLRRFGEKKTNFIRKMQLPSRKQFLWLLFPTIQEEVIVLDVRTHLCAKMALKLKTSL